MTVLVSRVKMRLGRWRNRLTHKFVSPIWGLLNPNTCERVQEKERKP